MIPDFKDLAQIYQQRALESLSEEDLAHAKRYRIAAELEAALRECREALVLTQDGSEFAACLPDEWSFAADKDWNQMKEAIAKIDEVLNEDR